jgi:NADP-dependent 3-hydroxy acid dehydrogenase YdfG
MLYLLLYRIEIILTGWNLYFFWWQSISPGLVRTEFQDGFPDDGTKEAVSQMPALKPEDIAEAVLYILSTPPHVQVCFSYISSM